MNRAERRAAEKKKRLHRHSPARKSFGDGTVRTICTMCGERLDDGQG